MSAKILGFLVNATLSVLVTLFALAVVLENTKTVVFIYLIGFAPAAYLIDRLAAPAIRNKWTMIALLIFWPILAAIWTIVFYYMLTVGKKAGDPKFALKVVTLTLR